MFCVIFGFLISVHSSRVIDSLNEDTEVTALYYYFSDRNLESRENINLVRSLLLQLLEKKPPRSHGYWQAYYRQHRAIEETLSVKEVLNILQSIMRGVERLCIVIDAVDWTMNQRETSLILETLSEVASVLATSGSFVPQLLYQPAKVRTIHLNESIVEQDVLLFLLDSFMNDSRLRKWQPQLQTDVIEALTSGANGM